MTTTHFSISHTDAAGTTEFVAALVGDTFHASRNSANPEELAQVEDACRFLTEDEDNPDFNSVALNNEWTVSKVDPEVALLDLLNDHITAKVREREAYKRYVLAPEDSQRARAATLDIEHQISHLMAPGGKAEVTLTLDRETRTFAITTMADINQPMRAYSDTFIGLYQKYAGGKLWTRRIHFWAKNGRWVSSSETILNRSGYQLIGWADKAPESAKSQHNSAF